MRTGDICALCGGHHYISCPEAGKVRYMEEPYGEYHARLQLIYHDRLPRPYFGALYRNRRSGLEWQVQTSVAPGELTLRRQRTLRGGFGWFRWLHVGLERLEQNFDYLGPTPEDHYLWGYDLSHPMKPIV